MNRKPIFSSLLALTIAFGAVFGVPRRAAAEQQGPASVSSYSAAQWNVTVVDSVASPTQISIAVHPTSQMPYISYRNGSANGQGLWRARRTGTLAQDNCATGWSCTLIDGTTGAGNQNSIAFQPWGGGTYAIAYTRFSPLQLILKEFQSNGTTNTYPLVDAAAAGYSSIAFSSLAYSGSSPVVAFQSSVNNAGSANNAAYTHSASLVNISGAVVHPERSYSVPLAISDPKLGQFPALAYSEQNGNAQMAFQGMDGALRFAEYTGSGSSGCQFLQGGSALNGWHCAVVDPAPGVVEVISLQAPRSLGGGQYSAPQIAYLDKTAGVLKYAQYVGGNNNCGAGGAAGWACIVIDNVGASARGVSLALTSAGIPLIAYQDVNDTSHGILKVAQFGFNGNCGPDTSGPFGKAWHCYVVDAGTNPVSDVGRFAALALDANGQGYIAYKSEAEGLKVAAMKNLSTPALAKEYLPASILQGAHTYIRYTITNNLPSQALTGLTFDDLLLWQFVSAIQDNTCGGATDVSTIILPGGIARQRLALNGGAVGAGGSCQIVVDVTGTQPGVWDDETGQLISNEAVTAPSASATLNISTGFTIYLPIVVN